MLYEPGRDDTDGFVCDGEWVSRSTNGVNGHHWEAVVEWQEHLDEEFDRKVAAAPGFLARSPNGEGGSYREAPGPAGRRDTPLEGLRHGGGKPSAGGGLWRYRRRG